MDEQNLPASPDEAPVSTGVPGNTCANHIRRVNKLSEDFLETDKQVREIITTFDSLRKLVSEGNREAIADIQKLASTVDQLEKKTSSLPTLTNRANAIIEVRKTVDSLKTSVSEILNGMVKQDTVQDQLGQKLMELKDQLVTLEKSIQIFREEKVMCSAEVHNKLENIENWRKDSVEPAVQKVDRFAAILIVINIIFGLIISGMTIYKFFFDENTSKKQAVLPSHVHTTNSVITIP